MRIISNYVLIKGDPTDRIRLDNGTELYFDTRFEEQLAACQSGTVVAVPEKLTFSTKMGEPGLEVKTEMELQIGDHVVFNFNAHFHAVGTGMVINNDFLVRYDEIYVARRNGQVICLNGSVIVEPLVEELPDTKLVIPDMMKNKKQKQKGTVVYASAEPHKQFRNRPDLNTMASPMVMLPGGGFGELGRYVKPGDVALFHFSNAIPLQHYHEINGAVSKKLLYRMMHTDIEIVIQPVHE